MKTVIICIFGLLIDKEHYPHIIFSYRNDPKFSNRLAWANSADQDQTAPLGAV